MDFTTPTFLFLFFPGIIILHSIIKDKYRNIVALAASIVFYALGNLIYLPVILFSIIINFYLGRLINTNRGHEQTKKNNAPLLWGIGFNIALLFVFKFISRYSPAHIFNIFPDQYLKIIKHITMPIGLSYITFQNISYLVDISNEIISPENNFTNYATYTLFFPKILVGPIVLYRQFIDQIEQRKLDIGNISNGARRFIIGLAKKVLIADTIARTINPSLDLPSPEFSSQIAWFILIGYTIQIYFDFSGYTDMALGLSRMMGFSFNENFHFPYMAESITDFWRRWHGLPPYFVPVIMLHQ